MATDASAGDGVSLDAVVPGFHFLRPWWWLLLPLLLLLLWYLYRSRRQSGGWQAVCDVALLPHLLITAGDVRQRRGALLIVALAGLLAITALAGPSWKQLEQPVFRDQSALVLILDLSRSMDATDMRPTRLTRARLKLIDILKQRKEGQAALVVYAAEAFAVSPLSEDAETIIAQVASLTTTLMPSQGSRPDLAIDLAQQLLTQAGAQRGDLLLITDGLENVPQGALNDSMAALRQAGYLLSVLGVGHADGAPIVLPDGGFLQDHNGAIVIPRLDEVALRELAQQGGGRYSAMRVDDRDIAILLEGSALQDEVLLEAADGFKADQWREEGPWLLLLLIPLVLVGFRRGYLLLVCLVMLPLLGLLPGSVQAVEDKRTQVESSWWNTLWSTPDQQAARAFERDDVAQAAQQFENSEWKAAAYYRAGEYEQSIAALTEVSLKEVGSAEILYNKGNAHVQLGQWQAALEAYDRALDMQPGHEDAKYNRELVQQQLQQQPSDDSHSEQGSEDASSPQDESQQDESQSEAGQTDESRSGESEQQSSPSSSPSSQSDSGATDEQLDEMDRQMSSRDAESADEAPMNEAETMAAEAQEQKVDEGTEPDEATTASELSETQAEIQQANDQWLRRIPDDPGGLLRRKFQYQSQRAKNRSGGQQRSEEGAW